MMRNRYNRIPHDGKPFKISVVVGINILETIDAVNIQMTFKMQETFRQPPSSSWNEYLSEHTCSCSQNTNDIPPAIIKMVVRYLWLLELTF